MTVVDEALERFHATGDEFGGGLTNHGPMVVDALARLGAHDEITPWARRYERVLERNRDDPVAPVQGDWRAAVRAQVPSLVRGAAAAAGHGAIRTAHAVSMLEDADTTPRRVELARALAYWRRSYDEVALGPRLPAPSIAHALAQLAPLRPEGGRELISERLRRLGPVPTFEAPIDDVVDAAARALLASSPRATVALVHAVTTPVALQALAPYAPDVALEAWLVSAALIIAYADALDGPIDHDGSSLDEAVGRAIDGGDEHAIKLAAACRGRSDPVHVAAIAAVTTRL